jgi:hypothetical protein
MGSCFGGLRFGGLRLVVGGWLVVCGLAAAGVAQTVPAQGERYRVETAAAADGSSGVTITNVSQVPITAFRATYVCAAHKVLQFAEDTVIVGMGTAQAPKSTLSFALPQQDCTGGVSVLVFADGQHVGDEGSWKQVLAQRRAAYEEVSGLLTVAEGMAAKEWTLAAFLAAVERREAALKADQAMSLDERRGRLLALEVARQGFGLEKGTAVRTAVITALIKWDGALGDAGRG